ncbi:MAG: hypothetical protein CMM35_10780 [Rhodospirillaceae bacterium]|nr:hypothetical protein [Rhodospirillaceae bacterium]
MFNLSYAIAKIGCGQFFEIKACSGSADLFDDYRRMTITHIKIYQDFIVETTRTSNPHLVASIG